MLGVTHGCDRAAIFQSMFDAWRTEQYANLGAIMYWQWNEAGFPPTYLGAAGSDPATDAWRTELATFPQRWATSVLLSDGDRIAPSSD